MNEKDIKIKINSLNRLYSKHQLKRSILLDNIDKAHKEIVEIDKYCDEIIKRIVKGIEK